MNRLGALLLACGLSACAQTSAEEPRTPVDAAPAPSEPVLFSFGTLSGEELSSATTRGRTTALLFLTTFDLASQAQARQLEQAIRRHRPRANGGVVVLEPPKNAPLVQVWQESLGLTLPVAFADPLTLQGEGAFGAVSTVPAWIVLDRRGRVTATHAGVLAPEALEQALAAAER